MWRTGHSPIKAEMKRRGSPLAGEMSAHIFIADGYYGYDDALYAAVRVLSILQKSAENLADFRDSLPPVVNTPEIRIPCSEDRKQTVIQEIRARLEAAGHEINNLDGIRVQLPGGWWLLRASNTQNVLVARCEADSRGELEELVGQVRGQLAASGLEFPFEL